MGFRLKVTNLFILQEPETIKKSDRLITDSAPPGVVESPATPEVPNGNAEGTYDLISVTKLLNFGYQHLTFAIFENQLCEKV